MQKKSTKKYILASVIFLAAFLTLVVMLKTVDVQAVGPNGSSIGLATINTALLSANGGERSTFNNFFYTLTEIIGYIAIFIALFIAATGLIQLIRTKDFKQVSKGIYLLGAVYILLAIVYIFFEKVIINYRPIIIDGELEAAFPSSHTLLSLCIFATAMLHIIRIGKNKRTAVAIFTTLMVVTAVGRLLSGVHWFTDVLGGVLLSGAIVFAYAAAANTLIPNKKRKKQ